MGTGIAAGPMAGIALAISVVPITIYPLRYTWWCAGNACPSYTQVSQSRFNTIMSLSAGANVVIESDTSNITSFVPLRATNAFNLCIQFLQVAPKMLFSKPMTTYPAGASE